MPVPSAFHEKTFAALREPELSRVVGLLRRLLLRDPPRARVQRHPQRGGADRRHPALQVPRSSGRDATRLVDRIVTRDLRKVSVGQVIYTPWCDERGKVIDDGTVSRLAENTYRWTAADPSLRWFRQNALGLDVDDRGHLRAGGLAGPSGADLRPAARGDRRGGRRRTSSTSGSRAGRSRACRWTSRAPDTRGTSATRSGSPGSEARQVWDALMEGGRAFDVHAAGMLALDVARIEAGLLLIDVDFNSSKKALIESQKYSPLEMGLGGWSTWTRAAFVGQAALARREPRSGPARQIVGLEIDWNGRRGDLRQGSGCAPGPGGGLPRRGAGLRTGTRRSGRPPRRRGRRR